MGRRPSTHGAPSNLRLNAPRPGNGGTPSLLVDYAFDGMTVGWAPDIEGFRGLRQDLLRQGLRKRLPLHPGQLLRIPTCSVSPSSPSTPTRCGCVGCNEPGFKIFDAPKMRDTYFGNTMPKINLGTSTGTAWAPWAPWAGGGWRPQLFRRPGHERHPSQQQRVGPVRLPGLAHRRLLQPEAPATRPERPLPWGCYDLPSRTKLGVEYNHGSKNWITFAPAATDMWTSKASAPAAMWSRGFIQELASRPISSHLAKTFVAWLPVLQLPIHRQQQLGGRARQDPDVNGQMMTTTPPTMRGTRLRDF